jgi:hypothetical protein
MTNTSKVIASAAVLATVILMLSIFSRTEDRAAAVAPPQPVERSRPTSGSPSQLSLDDWLSPPVIAWCDGERDYECDGGRVKPSSDAPSFSLSADAAVVKPVSKSATDAPQKAAENAPPTKTADTAEASLLVDIWQRLGSVVGQDSTASEQLLRTMRPLIASKADKAPCTSYEEPCQASIAANPSSPSSPSATHATSQHVPALRDVAQQLDMLADALERQDLYERADQLREQAARLRQDARSALAAGGATALPNPELRR